MKEGWRVKELCRFTLPSIPKSVNSLYQINFAQRRTYLNPEAALWKTQMKLMVPRLKDIPSNSFIKLDRTYYFNFFHKNGKLKKVDTANLDKLLMDTISEKCGLDDCLFKFGETESYNDVNEHTEIVVSVVWKEGLPSCAAVS